MIWELWQQHLIHRAEGKALDAEAKTATVVGDIVKLRDAVDRLALINRAMWELLSTRAGVSELDLIAKVEEVDLRDGKADGKLERNVRTCAQCQRTLHKRHLACLYCGAKNDARDVFSLG
jgi:hypothetical protein